MLCLISLHPLDLFDATQCSIWAIVKDPMIPLLIGSFAFNFLFGMTMTSILFVLLRDQGELLDRQV